MPIWAPPLSDRNVSPKEVSHSMTTVEIMFKKNFFLDRHGEVVSYAVLVAEDYTKVLSELYWACLSESYNVISNIMLFGFIFKCFFNIISAH